MRVIKINNIHRNADICLDDENKRLSFVFGGNGDLYWIIKNKNHYEVRENDFEYFAITKENYGIYSSFARLYYDIENINIFGPKEYDYSNSYRNISEQEEYSQAIKKQYRLFNRANYNDLFNEEEKTITWHSDETAYEIANILKIRKLADTFRIEFYVQPHIDDYDEDFSSHGRIPIRFRNSASLYEPFNIVFMRMFDQLQTVDDVKDNYHQIHFDEYLYEMNKSLILSKK